MSAKLLSNYHGACSLQLNFILLNLENGSQERRSSQENDLI